jgi:hypothetical protein
MPEKDTDVTPRRAAFLTIFPGAQPPAWNCVLALESMRYKMNRLSASRANGVMPPGFKRLQERQMIEKGSAAAVP